MAPVFSVPVETVLPGMAGGIMDDYCRGRTPESEFWKRTCAKNGWRGDIAAAKRILRENMHIRIPGTEEVLRELASAGHRTYLLSDHGREWIDYLLEAHSFFEVFERRFFSFEFESIKREAVTFQKLLSELGSPSPESVIFIDDFADNVAVAGSLGIDALRFTNAGELRSELTQRNLP